MAFIQLQGLRLYTFDIFPKSITHGIFSRQGGVSPAPWYSLNVGGMVGDQPDRVTENRNRSLKSLGRDPASIHDVWLIHSNQVVYAESPREAGTSPQKADILVTDRPGITLFMRFADCLPILIYDPVRHVVGMVHAGWLGTVRKVTESAVRELRTRFGCKPSDLLVGIGPSIGPDHYEVGSDVIDQIRSSQQHEDKAVIDERDGKTYLDLWKINEMQLLQSGVKNIENPEICTACHTKDWFSHRAENGKTGRFGALIALNL